jgi:site-specific DNA-methyltransferase (adenine-specific)
MPELNTNVLYYGDNLDILRKYTAEGSVDLIYLDPPFNSQADYNILFREATGAGSDAQIEAFGDTWHWGTAAAKAYEEVVTGPKQEVAGVLKAMVEGLRHNDVTAYLCMMAVRLVELHRVLRQGGSIYLHCDPTAGHYLKVLMDSVFGPTVFRNEIVWRRTGAHNKGRRFAPIHDTLLFYTKGPSSAWAFPARPYMQGHVDEFFVKDGDWYRTNYFGNVLTGSGVRGGESGKPWRGFDPTAKGRHWAIPKRLLDEVNEDFTGWGQHEKMDRLYELGYIRITPGEAWPIYEHRITPADGQPMSDIWSFQPYTGGTVFGTQKGVDEDVRWLSPRDKERLGYPTQKPLALLERIINASSNPGGIVLDPFCGCGTAVHAAQRLGRLWIGIDITHLAIGLVRRRMRDAFPSLEIEVIGEPRDLSGARDLAQRDKYQFQWWALDRLGAQPVSGKKKGADKGIDGVIPVVVGGKAERPVYGRVIVSVKGGEHVNVAMVRDLVGVLEREKEPIGVLLTLEPPTQPMVTEAATAGFYHNDLWQKDYARVQILTVEEMLAGKRPDIPPTRSPFAQAPLEREERRTRRML